MVAQSPKTFALLCGVTPEHCFVVIRQHVIATGLPAWSHLDSVYIFVCLLTSHHSGGLSPMGLALPGRQVAYCTQQDGSYAGLLCRGIWPAWINSAGWDSWIETGWADRKWKMEYINLPSTWETWGKKAETWFLFFTPLKKKPPYFCHFLLKVHLVTWLIAESQQVFRFSDSTKSFTTQQPEEGSEFEPWNETQISLTHCIFNVPQRATVSKLYFILSFQIFVDLFTLLCFFLHLTAALNCWVRTFEYSFDCL